MELCLGWIYSRYDKFIINILLENERLDSDNNFYNLSGFLYGKIRR